MIIAYPHHPITIVSLALNSYVDLQYMCIFLKVTNHNINNLPKIKYILFSVFIRHKQY